MFPALVSSESPKPAKSIPTSKTVIDHVVHHFLLVVRHPHPLVGIQWDRILHPLHPGELTVKISGASRKHHDRSVIVVEDEAAHLRLDDANNRILRLVQASNIDLVAEVDIPPSIAVVSITLPKYPMPPKSALFIIFFLCSKMTKPSISVSPRAEAYLLSIIAVISLILSKWGLTHADMQTSSRASEHSKLRPTSDAENNR